MSGEKETMNCTEFQALLPELIGSGIEFSSHPHYRECAHCQALMQDLEAIAEAARKLLPVEDPPEALWTQIEKAIEVEEALARSRPGGVQTVPEDHPLKR
jgi:hypothetical protein